MGDTEGVVPKAAAAAAPSGAPAGNPAGGGAGKPAVAAPVLPPDDVRKLLAKRDAGKEKLTPQEHGKLGAWAAAAGIKLAGRPKHGAGGAAAGAVVAGAANNPDRARRAIAAFVRGLDKIGKTVVGAFASQVGADEPTRQKIVERVAMDAEVRDVIIEVGPDACAELGWDPSGAPVAVVGAAISAYVSQIGLVCMELRAIAREQAKQAAAVVVPAKPAEVVA